MSEARLAAAAASIYSEYSARHAVRPQLAAQFSLASLLMFVTLVCVMLGVSTIAAGIGIPLGLILLVVWVPTVMWALAPRPQRSASSWLSSMGAVLPFIAVAMVVAIAAMLLLVVSVLSAVGEFCGNLPGGV